MVRLFRLLQFVRALAKVLDPLHANGGAADVQFLRIGLVVLDGFVTHLLTLAQLRELAAHLLDFGWVFHSI